MSFRGTEWLVPRLFAFALLLCAPTARWGAEPEVRWYATPGTVLGLRVAVAFQARYFCPACCTGSGRR